ncbi:SMI1/KNR4 family protein [Streptomyces sp. NPDC002722]|uniref:SMI1/KNR4 family protein n=1 Tax=Streptomyces sp. NPDC002722 TaxID=3154425 RepID=UPI003322EF77
MARPGPARAGALRALSGRGTGGPPAGIGRCDPPQELAALEARLGTVLPPSYREFLLTSDGWLDTTSGIRRLLPVREIGWVRDLDPELTEGWTGGGEPDDVPDEQYFVHGDEQEPWTIRTEYLNDLLKISHTPGALDVYLLNPRVVTPDGEWEAWYFAHWLPGAVRHRSFRDLMHDEYRSFRGDRG